MRNRPVMDLVAALVVLGSAAGVFFVLDGYPAAPDPRPHRASGWALAQEALRQLKPGGQITVITRDTEAFRHPESRLQFRSFEQALRVARVAIATTHALQVDPLKPFEVPPGDFFELICRAGAGSVIVSFMGPPLLTAEQTARLGTVRPRIIAFCPGALPQRLDLRVLFDAGLLHAAVISRPAGGRTAAPPGSLQGWFDRHYQWVWADNVGRLYQPVEGRP
jgi:hypothetical protein